MALPGPCMAACGGGRRCGRGGSAPPMHQRHAACPPASPPCLAAAASATARFHSILGGGSNAVGTMAAAGAQGTAADSSSSAGAGASAYGSADASAGGLMTGQGMLMQWLQPFLDWCAGWAARLGWLAGRPRRQPLARPSRTIVETAPTPRPPQVPQVEGPRDGAGWAAVLGGACSWAGQG